MTWPPEQPSKIAREPFTADIVSGAGPHWERMMLNFLS